MKVSLLFSILVLSSVRPSGAAAQTPEVLVAEFFQGRNNAPAEATSVCPGDDATADATLALLMLPRSESEMRRLLSAWGYVPECRRPQVMEWYRSATNVLTSRADARILTVNVAELDPVGAGDLFIEAGASDRIAAEARDAYQVAALGTLAGMPSVDFYVTTFRRRIQGDTYAEGGLRAALAGSSPAETAALMVDEVVGDPQNPRALSLLRSVLGFVISSTGRDTRQRVWSTLEPRLGGLPEGLRDVVRHFEADLRSPPR